MLEAFEISSTSGIVLWSKLYTPIGNNLVDSLIRDVFIEEKISLRQAKNDKVKPFYKIDGYTLTWTVEPDMQVIFVAVYQSFLHISWVDQFLDNIRVLFVNVFKQQLASKNFFHYNFDFDSYYEHQIKKFDGVVIERRVLADDSKVDNDDTVISKCYPSTKNDFISKNPLGTRQQIIANEETPSTASNPSDIVSTDDAGVCNLGNIVKLNEKLITNKANPPRKQNRRGRRAGKAGLKAKDILLGEVSDGDASLATRKGKEKQMRKWDAHGMAIESNKDVTLDYSEYPPTEAIQKSERCDVSNGAGYVNKEALAKWGKRTNKGEFVLGDLNDEIEDILRQNSKEHLDVLPSNSSSSIAGFFGLKSVVENILGGRVLNKDILEGPINGMREHLVKKNVAHEAAVRLCNTVEQDLLGLKSESFTSVESTIRKSMLNALTKMLTPTSSLNLLYEINQTIKGGKDARFPRRPYTISIVGVNGVGKSTNLAKLAFFLIQNNLRVLMVAGDTFRSGAVEQLKVHVENLQELASRQNGNGKVALFERGYGRDAAVIASEAVKFASQGDWDVVLIDTAGRRHNDQRLMGNLEKFAKLVNPDKIFMVAEALVGSDSVQQARNFDIAFGVNRKLDGFIVSKCDTVGDMVGTLISMIHATGIPVVFLGIGQTYTDLRTLSVSWVTKMLLG